MNSRVFVMDFANNTPHTIAVLQWAKVPQCKLVVVDFSRDCEDGFCICTAQA